MINFEDIYKQLKQSNSFKKIKTISNSIGIYCGFRELNLPSIAFLSEIPPVYIESTKYIKVSQWCEKDNLYWTSFDLQLHNAESIFYSLCSDLFHEVNTIDDQNQALLCIKNRYTIWKAIFKQANKQISPELYQGLFGELYFLYKYLINTNSVETAIRAWSGSEKTAKDFSIAEEWYEIKTISSGSKEVHISSLEQLESENDGHLIVIKVEKMSESYSNGESTVNELITLLLERIIDISLKDLLIGKIVNYGYSVEAEVQGFPCYKVNTMDFYKVSQTFPRIINKNVPYKEITKVSYTISLNSISLFLEEKDANN